MTVDFFIQKFNDKTNSELNEIARNNFKYVIEARIAALKILKNRSYESNDSNKIDKELDILENILNTQIQNNQKITDEVAKKLRNIKINKSLKILLGTKNELQIKRLSSKIFQIRIEHYNSGLSPVAICILNDNGEKYFFPFFYINSILLFVIISFSLPLYFYITQNKIPDEIVDISLWIIPFIALFQIVTTPFIYPWILRTFNEEMEKKNIS